MFLSRLLLRLNIEIVMSLIFIFSSFLSYHIIITLVLFLLIFILYSFNTSFHISKFICRPFSFLVIIIMSSANAPSKISALCSCILIIVGSSFLVVLSLQWALTSHIVIYYTVEIRIADLLFLLFCYFFLCYCYLFLAECSIIFTLVPC